jgi:hypothetical protein
MGTIIGSCQLLIIKRIFLSARRNASSAGGPLSPRVSARSAGHVTPPPPVSPEAGPTWKKSESEASIDCGGSLKKPPYLRADRRGTQPLLRNNLALHFPQSLLFIFKGIFLCVCVRGTMPRARAAGCGRQAVGGAQLEHVGLLKGLSHVRVVAYRPRGAVRARARSEGVPARSCAPPPSISSTFFRVRVSLWIRNLRSKPNVIRWCGPGRERAMHALLKSQQDKERRSKAAVHTFPDC